MLVKGATGMCDSCHLGPWKAEIAATGAISKPQAERCDVSSEDRVYKLTRVL